jgi:membrane protein implicated in regulation of membrane protease activity
MTFSFKLFKALTSINLFFSGFFLMMLVMTLLSGNPQALIFMILIGAVFIHCILSLYLQRSLIDKSLPLKESTPGGIQIMGGFALIWAGMLLMSGAVYLLHHKEVLIEMQKQMDLLSEEQRKEITPAKLNSMMNAIMLILSVLGVMIVTNSFLSFIFVRKWRERRDEPKIDINAES